MSARVAAAVAPALAAGAGLALLVAHPPVSWWWTTFLAPALLLAALATDARDAASTGRGVRAARLGGVAGIAAFAPLLSWLILPAGYLGWGLLVVVQVVWLGLLGALVRPFLEHPLLPVVCAVVWTGIDAWRAVFPMNGFEWGAIAYAHAEGSWLLPTARLVGGRGITFLVVLISAAAFVLVRATLRGLREREERPVEQVLGTTRGPVVILLVGLVLSVVATIEPPPEVGELDVVVVQGNDIRHWIEPVADAPLTVTTAMRDLTIEAVAQGGPADLVVWPESSIDRDPSSPRGAPLRPLVDEAARAAGTLLAGATLDGPDPTTHRYVSAVLYEDEIHAVDRYDKRRLVPFGEYVPARALLDWIPPLAQVPRDTIPGEERRLTLDGGVVVAPIICYETMFTEIVRSQVRGTDRDAALIVTLTNNASYGDSAMPRQHLAQSRLRAVETGRWVVHAAISGSSAFVGPDGSLEQPTALFERATIRRAVPLVEGTTPYLVTGDLLGWLTRLLTLATALWVIWRWWSARGLRASR